MKGKVWALFLLGVMICLVGLLFSFGSLYYAVEEASKGDSTPWQMVAGPLIAVFFVFAGIRLMFWAMEAVDVVKMSESADKTSDLGRG